MSSTLISSSAPLSAIGAAAGLSTGVSSIGAVVAAGADPLLSSIMILSATISPNFLQATTLWYSTASLRAPVGSLQTKFVATEKDVTLTPDGVVRTSGSRVKRPTIVARLTSILVKLKFKN